MNYKRIFAITLVCAALACTACSGSDTGDPAPSSNATAALDSRIVIEGTTTLTLSGENYQVSSRSNIPDGAFVTVYIMDENGAVLQEVQDVRQRDGAVSATVSKATIDASIGVYNSTKIHASIEFMPGSSSQPGTIKEICGAKGEYLDGTHVQEDPLENQKYILLESDEITL